MRKVYESSQLRADFINHVSLWTQFHNVPHEMLSAEGVLYLARKIGAPVSEVEQGYYAGRLYMKAKVSFNASEPLEDKLMLNHPSLGKILIYLVYERAGRLCPHCGRVGHDLSGCARRNQILTLCADLGN
ncbi:Zinc knuckle [Carex littledalei]|uniref:Zinc knuckle n=1 Tax=Carex littledalei TaxID=544730 RepID=A0A833QNP8_9POAL|nr:Zinc knuckle [Carex littledalei]